MRHYVGIDLHCNNNFLVIIDEADRIVFQQRLANDLQVVLRVLEHSRGSIVGIAVESTFNWYWLVDGLKEAGYELHLVNTAAVKQYEGLKHQDDQSDARWLAHLLRLGLLPTGYIYPREARPLRDLLRKRAHLVRQQTANTLSIENLYARNLGLRIRCKDVRQLSPERIHEDFKHDHLALAATSSLAVLNTLRQQIRMLERVILAQVFDHTPFQLLETINGVGKILAMTIYLETGQISRFRKPGNYLSYCRCVGSSKLSNQKKKGEGNRKNGNKYLAWAFIEAATFALRWDLSARRFYQRKQAKRGSVVARKALAHKLCRASYYVMRDQVRFSSAQLFA